MSTEKVHFTKERETNLITLYARAMQSQWEQPILPDKWAVDAVSHIDYDFAKLKQTRLEAISIAIRAKSFDQIVTRYLAAHPDATVVYLGCGMDSSVFRVDPPATVQWYDVDYPDVIELRRRLYPDRANYHLIGTSLADLQWIDALPADHPAIIVAEGVTMYLTEDIVKPLLNALTKHFPSGEIAFDAFSKFGLWTAQRQPSIKGTGAVFGWGIGDPQDIKALDPQLELVSESRTPEFPDFDRLPASMRAVVHVMELFPPLRRMNRVLVYRF